MESSGIPHNSQALLLRVTVELVRSQPTLTSGVLLPPKCSTGCFAFDNLRRFVWPNPRGFQGPLREDLYWGAVTVGMQMGHLTLDASTKARA